MGFALGDIEVGIVHVAIIILEISFMFSIGGLQSVSEGSDSFASAGLVLFDIVGGSSSWVPTRVDFCLVV